MDDVARLPAGDRRDLFVATAANRGVRAELIEKDFWVCWVLKRLFTLKDFPAGLIFKGGTSLSKAFGAIQRFSEDVDLSFDRTALGYGGTDELAKMSRNKRDATLKALATACEELIRDRFIPQLTGMMGAELQKAPGPAWSLETHPEDKQAVLFRYPSGVELASGARYVQPVVLLELGGRSDHWPAVDGTVRSYAAEAFPSAFKAPSCTLRVLSAERTFWEKATLLHRWYYRSDKAMDQRQSRHHYDVAQLYTSGPGKAAVAKPELLIEVARYKSVFYEDRKARYDLAVPGTLRLLPHENHLEALKRDYDEMGEMIFGEPPTFESILSVLAEIEGGVNAASIEQARSPAGDPKE